jgi:hypothetical protein
VRLPERCGPVLFVGFLVLIAFVAVARAPAPPSIERLVRRFSKVFDARRGEVACWTEKKRGMVFAEARGLVTMQHNGNERRIDTAEYWHVRSQETRSRAEKMITPQTRHLMLGLADDYERTAHIVEGMASIHGALASVMASIYGLLPQQ